MLRDQSNVKAYPVSGGCITRLDKGQLKFGEFSWAQNVRGDHPGLRQRLGQDKLHLTAITGTPSVINLYQYRSARGQVQKVFAQLDNDDLWAQAIATLTIPDQLNGAFGSLFHTGSSGTIPASFADVRDHMIYSNGADQHQIYCGGNSLIDRFMVFDGSAAPGDIPDSGRDYSDNVRDLVTASRVAVLDSLNTYAAFECIFIKTKTPAASLAFAIAKANGSASVLTLYYWNGTDWTHASATDGTTDGGATLAVDGAITWTSPGDAEQEKFMYGQNGFWYQIRVSAQLDSEVEISSVLFDDVGFNPLRNIWDGFDEFAIEAQVYLDADSTYSTYGGGAVDIGALTSDDALYVAYPDKVEAFYVDPGVTPNAVAAVVTISYWNGTSWTAHGAGVVTDGTGGVFGPGWITFPRTTDEHPREFNSSKYQAFWYKITVDATLSDECIIGITCMPYFDILDLGQEGNTCCAWKERAVYSFNNFGAHLYVARANMPYVLNGSDFGILRAGDGRYNDVVAQRNFVNELMVWQEELGSAGGCVTIFEGYSPTTFGKLVLSTKVGTMNAKTVVVVDGVMTSTKTESRLKTLAFFLSRYGLCVTDGRTISIISDDIENYFDQDKPECIRAGQEKRMWLNHDSAENVLRIGLVTSTPRSTGTTTQGGAAYKLINEDATFTTDGTVAGDTAYNTTDQTTALVTAIDSDTTLSLDTDIMNDDEDYSILASTPNVFPVFDLVDKTFSFDEIAQPLLCMTEVSADSGAKIEKPVVQLGGGVSDGFIYRLNTGDNDVSTAIDSYIDLEVNASGHYFDITEMVVRGKAQAAGNIYLSFYKNDVLIGTKVLDMTVTVAGNNNRRHKFYLNIQGDSATIRLQNSTVSQKFSLHDIGIGAAIWEGM